MVANDLVLLLIGSLMINRLIDPGRRIEYNFLGSINRKFSQLA